MKSVLQQQKSRNVVVSLVGMVAPVVIGAAIAWCLWGSALQRNAQRIVRDVGTAAGWIEEPESICASVTIGRDGSVSIDGEQVRPPVGDQTKTAVTTGAEYVNGVLGVYNQDQSPGGISAATKTWQMNAGGIVCKIEDISTTGWSGAAPNPFPDPARSLTFTFVVQMEAGSVAAPGYWEHHEFVYFYSDTPTPWDIEREFSIKTTGTERLWRELTSAASNGRTGYPVYAKENSVEDEWQTGEHPFSWGATFGTLSDSGTQSYYSGPGMWGPGIANVNGVQFYVNQHKGSTGYTYAAFELNWSAVALSFDGMGHTENNLRFVGSGNGVSMDLASGFTGTNTHGITINRPYIMDFSNFAVLDRDGALQEDLLIDGGWKADPRFPWTASCPGV